MNSNSYFSTHIRIPIYIKIIIREPVTTNRKTSSNQACNFSCIFYNGIFQFYKIWYCVYQTSSFLHTKQCIFMVVGTFEKLKKKKYLSPKGCPHATDKHKDERSFTGLNCIYTYIFKTPLSIYKKICLVFIWVQNIMQNGN